MMTTIGKDSRTIFWNWMSVIEWVHHTHSRWLLVNSDQKIEVQTWIPNIFSACLIIPQASIPEVFCACLIIPYHHRHGGQVGEKARVFKQDQLLKPDATSSTLLIQQPQLSKWRLEKFIHGKDCLLEAFQ